MEISISYQSSYSAPLNVSKLTKKDLREIIQNDDPSLTKKQVKKIACEFRKQIKTDNRVLKERGLTASDLGDRLTALILSRRFGSIEFFKVEQIESDINQANTNCFLCNETTNQANYKITNIKNNAFFTFTRIAVHYLKEHGFCGILEHRVEPIDALATLNLSEKSSEEATASEDQNFDIQHLHQNSGYLTA